MVAVNSEDVYEGSVEGRIVQGGSPQGAQPPRLWPPTLPPISTHPRFLSGGATRLFIRNVRVCQNGQKHPLGLYSLSTIKHKKLIPSQMDDSSKSLFFLRPKFSPRCHWLRRRLQEPQIFQIMPKMWRLHCWTWWTASTGMRQTGHQQRGQWHPLSTCHLHWTRDTPSTTHPSIHLKPWPLPVQPTHRYNQQHHHHHTNHYNNHQYSFSPLYTSHLHQAVGDSWPYPLGHVFRFLKKKKCISILDAWQLLFLHWHHSLCNGKRNQMSTHQHLADDLTFGFQPTSTWEMRIWGTFYWARTKPQVPTLGIASRCCEQALKI